jgi:hypothetical protein
MKNKFLKAIDWRKFLKWEIGFIMVVLFFYFTSPNKFPHNFYAIPTMSVLFAFMLLLNSYPTYLKEKLHK